jgi:Ser/Thr protein kinase RdoA (MazF antagonist)
MILRPYAEPIPKPPGWGGPRLLDSHKGLKPPDLVPQIEQALDIIMRELQKCSEELSAHQVMLAIDRRWKELAIFFMWG